MRRFLQSYCYRLHYEHAPGFDVFSFLDLAAAGGWDGVSININAPDYRQLSGTSLAHQDAVRAYLDARGLACDLETSGTELAHLEEILAVCLRIGAGQLRTYMRHAGSVDETIERTVADLRAAAPLFDAAGVRLLLENHEDYTGAELTRILDAVDHSAVGALFDYGNSMMVGEEPIVALAAILPHVRSAHLKDHACVLGDDGEPWVLGVPIGSGVLPIAQITQRLAAAGLDRVIVSSVWGYRAPVRSWRGGAKPGEGSFVVEQPPFDPLLRPWELAAPPAVLLERETEAVRLASAHAVVAEP